MTVLDRLKQLMKRGAKPGDVDRGAPPAAPDTGPGAEPDFADEHARPTYADEPSTEQPDESVPRDRGGAGGMDVG